MNASIPLTLLFAVAAVFSLVELVRSFRREVPSYIADREAHATHVVMNGGMAAMFAPLHDAAVGRVIIVFYAAAIVALVLDLAFRRGRLPGRAGGTIYHLVGLAAMLWATQRMMAMPGMADMAMRHGGTANVSWPALALLIVFALDGLVTAILAALMPRSLLRMADAVGIGDHLPPPLPGRIRAMQIAAVPHCLMDAGMVLMLAPMLRMG